MSNDILKQHCLQVLALHHERATGLSSRMVADELDISVYQARLLLLKLQEEGLVREVPGRKPGRGAALHWEISDAASSATS
ncbi:FaeA/PapI family transcriptional regulator [Enterobacter cloacae]|uniref:FaeA/PapI family transcriptional regulator n=1 Tax=Enterobacteriaceae TaxID=543 RepID=UPI0020032A68|nr:MULTISPECIES: FaeA/PapI family transcriptional regulator [Enterobacteriaceae]MCK7268874.1 FaeA/PapI family transcriptional regulator [Enterobacter cloacae]